MPNILDTILASKRKEIEIAKSRRPADQLRAQLDTAVSVRDFFKPLAMDSSVSLIAEVKKASPSRGVIRHDFDPVEIAQSYAANGAVCLSVLTDAPFFHGHLDYLPAIRRAVELPILRKDFILDSYQLLEARVSGADAVLLIAECLDDCQLRKLHNEAVELGMTPLVEFYASENCERVLEAGATLVGVNNRDLQTFEVDLEHAIRMRDRIPTDCVVVAESGIRTSADVVRLHSAKIDAMLVGEQLVAQPDVGYAVRSLLGSAAK